MGSSGAIGGKVPSLVISFQGKEIFMSFAGKEKVAARKEFLLSQGPTLENSWLWCPEGVFC